MKRLKKFWGTAAVFAVLSAVLVAQTVLPIGQTVHASGVSTDIWSHVTLDNDAPEIATPGTNDFNFVLRGFTPAEARLFVGNKTAAIKIPEELIGKISPSGEASVTVRYEIVRAFFDELGLTKFIEKADEVMAKISTLLSGEAAGLSVNIDEVYAALDVKNYLDSVGNLSVTVPITVSDDGAYFSLDFEDAAFKQFVSLIETAVANVGKAIDALRVNSDGSLLADYLADVINTLWSSVKSAYDMIEETVKTWLVGPYFLTEIVDLAVFRTTEVILPVMLTTDYSFFKTYAPQGLAVDFEGTITDPSLIDINLWSNPQDFTTITFADIVAPEPPTVLSIDGTETTGYVIKADDVETGVLITLANAAGDVLVTGNAGPVDLEVAAGAAKAGETLYLTASDTVGNVSEATTVLLPNEPTGPEPSETSNNNTGTGAATNQGTGLPVTGDDAALFGVLSGIAITALAVIYLCSKKRKNL